MDHREDRQLRALAFRHLRALRQLGDLCDLCLGVDSHVVSDPEGHRVRCGHRQQRLQAHPLDRRHCLVLETYPGVVHVQCDALASLCYPSDIDLRCVQVVHVLADTMDGEDIRGQLQSVVGFEVVEVASHKGFLLGGWHRRISHQDYSGRELHQRQIPRNPLRVLDARDIHHADLGDRAAANLRAAPHLPIYLWRRGRHYGST
mmetsp:Transcript_19388/g.56326  ORF Transcript_19388/g.56326 Transcript_19388/m.56326 type:complete len:203 (-) Transcript_19388:358-966(-)